MVAAVAAVAAAAAAAAAVAAAKRNFQTNIAECGWNAGRSHDGSSQHGMTGTKLQYLEALAQNFLVTV